MTSESHDLEALVDQDSLRAFLKDKLGSADNYKLSLKTGGYSNEIVAVTWGSQDLILRRPPLGSDADLLREYRVLSALQETPVPVPETVAVCEDDDVIGCEFYLMGRLQGDAMGVHELQRVATPERRKILSERVLDTLGEIHMVDPEAMGLIDVLRPQSPRRRVEIWGTVFDGLPNDDNRDLTSVAELGDLLREQAPHDWTQSLVHGDYRLENVMIAPETPPRIAGILDWENSTISDPLVDLGYLLVTWRDSTDDIDPVVPEWISPFTEQVGYLTRRELVSRYEKCFDRQFVHERFYRGLALYQIAVGGEVLYARYKRGSVDEPLFARLDKAVPALGARGLRIIHGEEPL